MVDEVQGSEVVAQDSVAPVETKVESVNDSPAADNTPQDDRPKDRVFTQAEVRRIAAQSKHEAYEKARKDLETQRPTQESDQKLYSEDEIRQMIQDEGAKQANMAMAQRIASEFTQKMQAGESKYPDFDNVVSDLNLPSIPLIVNWANSLDNTADIMYDLGKNPAKFANVMMLAQSAPHLAQRELKRLSDSIKKNEDAKAQKQPDEPLDQIKSSPTGTDNGSYTVSDFRKADWLRA